MFQSRSNQNLILKYLLKPLIITSSMFTLGVIIILFLKGLSGTNIIRLLIVVGAINWAIFFGIPLIILFTNHWRRVHNSKYVVNSNRKVLEETLSNKHINFTEIEKIVVFQSPSEFDNRFDFLQIGDYHYMKFMIKNGSVIDVSCFSFEWDEEVFKGIPVEYKKKLLPFF